jgi:hypothetical protein
LFMSSFIYLCVCVCVCVSVCVCDAGERTQHMLAKRSATESQPQTSFLSFVLILCSLVVFHTAQLSLDQPHMASGCRAREHSCTYIGSSLPPSASGENNIVPQGFTKYAAGSRSVWHALVLLEQEFRFHTP